MRTGSANKTAEKTEQESVAMKSERPAKNAKVVCGFGSDVRATSTAAHWAFFSERDKFKNRCEASMLENQYTPCLAEEGEQLRIKVADIEKNASAKATPVNVERKKLLTVVKKRVNALEVELKAVQYAEPQNIEAAEESENVLLMLSLCLQRPFDVLQRSKETQKQGLLG